MSTNRSPEWKGISRIDYKHTHGWFARVYLKGKRVKSKLFSDNLYASREDALEKAREWRDQEQAALSADDLPTKVRYLKRPPKSNTSGRVGISRTFTRSKADQNEKLWCFSVTWVPTPGKPKNRSFSFAIYGSEEAAFQAACEFRAAKERELDGQELSAAEREQTLRETLDRFTAYFDKVPQLRRERLYQIHAMILSEFPDVTLWLKSTHPCYQRGEHWVVIANRIRSVTIQVHPIENLAALLPNHPKSMVSETVVHYRDSVEFRLDDVRMLVRKILGTPASIRPIAAPANAGTVLANADNPSGSAFKSGRMKGRARITKAVKAYFQHAPVERQSVLWDLHVLILKACPIARLTLEHGVPAYENNGAWVMLNNQKKGVFVAVSNRAALAAFTAKHPDLNLGDTGLTFRPATTIPVADFQELVVKVLTSPPEHAEASVHEPPSSEKPVETRETTLTFADAEHFLRTAAQPKRGRPPKAAAETIIAPAPPQSVPANPGRTSIQYGLPVLTVFDDPIEEYLRPVPQPRQQHLRRLHEMIVTAFPTLKQSNKFRRPTYEGHDMWMSIGEQHNGITVHIKNGIGLEALMRKHPGLTFGKTWFNLNDDVTIPDRDFQNLIQEVFGPTETPAVETPAADVPEIAPPPADLPVVHPQTGNNPGQVILDYITRCPITRQPRLLLLHSCILNECPQVRMSMRSGMPTYEFDGRWVAMAHQRDAVALYVDDYASLIEFVAAHPGIQAGKNCVNFVDGNEIPVTDILAIIRKALRPKDLELKAA